MKLLPLRAKKRAAISRRFLLAVEQLERRELLAGTLTITGATVTEGDVGTSNAVFKVDLAGNQADVVTVNYSIVSTAQTTAQSGVDHRPADDSLVLFTDDFERTEVGPNWKADVGSVSIVSGKLTGTSTGVNVASLENFVQADAQIQANYDLGPGPGSRFAGLLARYRGGADTNWYQATVYGTVGSGSYTAAIWKHVDGTPTLLASASTLVTSGLMRFEVNGSALRLYINSQLVASAVDSSLQVDRVGVRVGKDSTIDNFWTSQAAGSAPFVDAFNRSDSSTPGPDWTVQAGNLAIANNTLKSTSATSGALATANGIVLNDTRVEADYVLNSITSTNFGLVTRYQGSGEQNFYLGAVFSSGGSYFANIWRNTGINSWTTLGGTSIAAPSSGRLRFEAQGSVLRLFVDDDLIVSGTDNTFQIGRPGLRFANDTTTTADNYQASVLATQPFRDTFNRPNNTVLGADWVEPFADNVSVSNNQVISIDTNGTAILNTLVLTDTQVKVNWSQPGGTFNAGLVSRYHEAAGAKKFYLGAIHNAGGNLTAGIWRYDNGTWFTLVTAAPTQTSGPLRFDVQGSLLRFFVNNVIQVSAVDSTYNIGRTGLRLADTISAFDNFEATSLVSARWDDEFNRTSLGPGYDLAVGQMQIQNNRVQVTSTGSGLHALTTITQSYLTDVSVEAVVTVTGTNNQQAGLFARYTGPGDTNFYLGILIARTTGLAAEIWKNVGGTWTQLSTNTVTVSSGKLRFEVLGNSLKL